MDATNKLLGYILSGIGLLGLAVSNVPLVRTYIPFSFSNSIFGTSLTIISIILVVAGVFFLLKTGGKKVKQAEEEVPIYQGNKIIGYRKAK